MTVDWNVVFNSDLAPGRKYGCITKALNVAREFGYGFMSWGGRIYDVYIYTYTGRIEDIGFSEDLPFEYNRPDNNEENRRILANKVIESRSFQQLQQFMLNTLVTCYESSDSTFLDSWAEAFGNEEKS